MSESLQCPFERVPVLYRKALWADADTYLEIWCEKDALAGVIFPMTADAADGLTRLR
jgi:hypothetical protein